MNSEGFDLTFDQVTLSVAQIWPDGDAPANPTAADVAAVMEKYGSLHRVLSDWNLIDGINVHAVGRYDKARFPGSQRGLEGSG